MSRKVYDDGVLLEVWDDDATTYRRFEDGALVEERPYTDDEAAPIVEREAEDARESAAQGLRDQLAAGVASIMAARATALEDREKAEALRTQALDAKAAAITQRTAVVAFIPAATYTASQLGQVRNAIADLLDRVAEIHQALAEFYAYRAAVDANAIVTDNALLWLARLAAGVRDDDEPEVGSPPLDDMSGTG